MNSVIRNIMPVAAVSLVAVCGMWLLAQPNPETGALAPFRRAAGDVHYTKLVIAGDAVDKGIYDPSVAYTPDGSVGWLAYSAVKGNGNLVKGKVSLGEYVSTHLARTADGAGQRAAEREEKAEALTRS